METPSEAGGTKAPAADQSRPHKGRHGGNNSGYAVGFPMLVVVTMRRLFLVVVTCSPSGRRTTAPPMARDGDCSGERQRAHAPGGLEVAAGTGHPGAGHLPHRRRHRVHVLPRPGRRPHDARAGRRGHPEARRCAAVHAARCGLSRGARGLARDRPPVQADQGPGGAAQAAVLCREATEIMFDASGGGSLALSNPSQRFATDARALCQHAALSPPDHGDLRPLATGPAHEHPVRLTSLAARGPSTMCTHDLPTGAAAAFVVWRWRAAPCRWRWS